MVRGTLRKNWCMTSRPDNGAPTPANFWAEHGPDGTGRVVYMAGQTEVSENGVRHYQWWLQLGKRERFTTLVTNETGTIFDSKHDHVEPCEGTEEQNEKYTKKTKTSVDGTVFTFGHFSVQGKSDKMDEIVEMIRQGAGWDELYAAHATYITKGHHAAAIRHMMVYIRPSSPADTFDLASWPTTGGWKEAMAWSRGDRLKTLLLCGPPGCGKTKWCQSLKLEGRETLVAQTKDDLKRLVGKHSLICLDDWDEELIELRGALVTQLMDRQIDISVKCRYEDAHISRGTAMVVCSNDDLAWVLNKHPGVPRRVQLVHVEAWDMAASLVEAEEKKQQAAASRTSSSSAANPEVIDLLSDSEPEDDNNKHDRRMFGNSDEVDEYASEDESEQDVTELQHSPHSRLQFAQNAHSKEDISTYYERLAAEQEEDMVEAEASSLRANLKRSDAQAGWSQHSSADTPARKRQRRNDDDDSMAS